MWERLKYRIQYQYNFWASTHKKPVSNIVTRSFKHIKNTDTDKKKIRSLSVSKIKRSTNQYTDTW